MRVAPVPVTAMAYIRELENQSASFGGSNVESNEMPLTVVNRVPFLVEGDAGARLLPQGTAHDMDGFFANMFREFSMTLHGSESAETAAPLATHFSSIVWLITPSSPIVRSVCRPKCVEHRPAANPWPMMQKQVVQVHGERINCDLVGPTRPSINDEVYALITLLRRMPFALSKRLRQLRHLMTCRGTGQ